MQRFSYQGLQGESRCNGELEAADRRSALSSLRQMGIVPLELNETEVSLQRGTQRDSARGASGLSLPQRVGAKDITTVTRQMATLMSSGFPLARALSFIKRQSDKGGVQNLVGEVDAKVRSGSPLSDAMSEHPRFFNPLYLSMIRAGEAGGILETLLDRLATMREADEALVAKIKGALTYPALMVLAMMGALVVLFSYVVPQFSLMFEEMGQALPTPTRIMMDIGGVFQNYWWALILGIAVAILGPLSWGRTPTGREALDRFKLRLPLMGGFVTQVAMARLCRTMGTLLDSGVSLTVTLESSRGVAGNVVVTHAITDSLKNIRQGKKVGETFAATGVFPDLVCEMISLGEESGQLGPMLLKVADVYERQTDELVKTLTSILEPVMILFMGGVVGMVVISMLMPIFSMNLMAG